MKRLFLLLALATVSAIFAPVPARATTYYVDCVNGVNGKNNPGTSPGSAWKTLSRVNAFIAGQIYESGNPNGNTTTDAGFNPGDSLLLKRGCSWDWHLTITPTNGTSGNFNGTGSSPAFSIDAYSNGAPPTIQGKIQVGLISSGLAVSGCPGGTCAIGTTAVALSASSANGTLIAGSPITFAGDSNTYYVASTVTAANNAISSVSFAAPGPTSLQHAAANGTAVTAYGWAGVDGFPHVYAAVVSSHSEGGGFYPSNISAVQIGGVWGNCKGQYSLSTPYCVGTNGFGGLANNYDWYYAAASGAGGCASNCGTAGSGTLYIYDSIGTNPAVDFGAVEAALDGYAQLLSVNGVGYVTIQHVKLLNYSWYGIEVTGASDNLIFANIFADTEVPFNFHGVGFYLHPSSASANISVLATESHRGYYGYQFAGSIASSGVTLSNCKAYFNRDAGLADLTASGTAVNYDHCHFYGNGAGSPVSSDIAINPNTLAPGGVAGAGNIAPNTDPHVVSWLNYTPRFTLNYRGPGYSFGSDVALNAQLPALGGAPLSIGIATNYSYSTSLIPQFNTWLAAGYDLNSLGLSAASYANSPALNVKYLGTCTSVALTVTGTPATSVAIAASGGTCPSGDTFSYTVTGTSTLSQLKAALAANTDYAVTWPQPCSPCSWEYGSAMLARDLATVSGQTLSTTVYALALNVDQFLKDETALSQSWIKTNLTGWGSTWVYLYPGTLFNPTSAGVDTIEGDVSGSGSPLFTGAVGASTMQVGRDGLSGAFDAVAANGVDAQGLTTYGLAGWANLTPGALQMAIQAAVEKASIWGVPQTLYFQAGTLSNAQLALIVSDLTASGATLMTDSGLVSFLTSLPRVQLAGPPNYSAGVYCSCWAWTPETGGVNLRPTYLSPTVGAGANLNTVYSNTAYQNDVNGIPQPQTWSAVNAHTSATLSKTGWDIGAQALVPIFTGGLRPGH